MKKNEGSDFKEPENAMGGLQLALHDVPFLKHSQIQGNYASILDNGPDNDEPQIRPENKKNG